MPETDAYKSQKS